jgi:hypothetical protein
MGGAPTVAHEETQGEGSAFTNAFLSEVVRSEGATASVARSVLGGRTTDGIVDIEPDADVATPGPDGAIVVGSGNLGLVYLTGFDHRLTVEELEALHPGMVGALAEHPGVSAILVRSASRGGLVLGKRGVRHLADGAVEGEDPLAPFGPNAITSLLCEDGMEHAPDVLLLSQYDPELGEVAAFEELIGSHGGLGGWQTEPFILHPAEWELDEPLPVGAPSVYRNLRRWLETMGIPLGHPTPAGPPM